MSAHADRRARPPKHAKRRARRHAFSITARRWLAAVAPAGGAVTADGVTYRPLTSGSLTRALSKRGPGFKDYDVAFPGGSRTRIRATRRRIFADLTEPRLLGEMNLLSGVVQPGSRALLLAAGTGDAAAWLAGRVGPSGSVVSLESDVDSVAFALSRYPLDNVAHEVGGARELDGEPDAAFGFVLAARVFDGADASRTEIERLWRLVAPGGTLSLSAAADKPTADRLAQALREATENAAQVSIAERGVVDVVSTARAARLDPT